MAGEVCVVGIGNVLMGDDALGPHVVRLLEARWEFDERVTLLDAGTPGIDLATLTAGAEALVIVDALKAEGPPGQVRLYREESLLKRAPVLATSPHDPGLREALLTMEFAGGLPRDILLVGVIPERIEGALGLSESVRAALPEVEAAVVAELDRLGHAPRSRSEAGVPDLWWERA